MRNLCVESPVLKFNSLVRPISRFVKNLETLEPHPAQEFIREWGSHASPVMLKKNCHR
jgi:hypothetical protein